MTTTTSKSPTPSPTPKIFGGLTLCCVGLLGLIFGRTIKSVCVRVPLLVISFLSAGAGFYFLLDGISDLAIGKVGQYKLDGAYQQTMTYDSQAAFEDGLKKAVVANPSLRRLSFSCPDLSKNITVYVSPYFVFNAPEQDIVCDNGLILLAYKQK